MTKWSKFGTRWKGVSVDTLLSEAARHGVVPDAYAMAISDGGAAFSAEIDRAAVRGPPSGRSMADVQQQHEQARVAVRERDASAGLDSAIESVRIDKETEFLNAHRAVLDRHRERQRNQVLPPE